MELDITKPKKLTFSISLAKVDIGTIKGTFKLYYDKDLSIGVSAYVESGRLVVRIPVLSFIDFDANKEYKAELEVIAGDFFTVPWTDKVRILKPIFIKVETEMKESKKELDIMVTKPIII